MAKLRKDGKPKQGGRPKVITDEWIETVADEILEWFDVEDNPETPLHRIWLKDFARTVKSPVTGMPYSWDGLTSVCGKNEKFSLALKVCKDIQESRLLKIGLTSKSTMAIFAQKNVAGWRDNPEPSFTERPTVVVIE